MIGFYLIVHLSMDHPRNDIHFISVAIKRNVNRISFMVSCNFNWGRFHFRSHVNFLLIFYFELIFCFEAVFKISFLICSFFSCYNISTLTTYLTIKHIYIVSHVSGINDSLTFLTNNVKGLQSSKKRTKLIEYLNTSKP